MIVAIDGPAGAGKSTVARAVAERLGFTYVDTGALYRAVTLAAIEAGVAPDDGPRVAELARDLGIKLQGSSTFISSRDVTQAIRASEVTSAVSIVAAQPEVRAVLASIQRDLLGAGSVVMEGRDIGSTIAPDAQVKVFLTASLDERARRRLLQLGMSDDPDAVASAARSIERRDSEDEGRESSPFVRPPDAVVIDSTGKPSDAIVDEIVAIASERRSTR
ncbi:MAG: (d)CMP kinase [Actinomycetota bacterium]